VALLSRTIEQADATKGATAMADLKLATYGSHITDLAICGHYHCAVAYFNLHFWVWLPRNAAVYATQRSRTTSWAWPLGAATDALTDAEAEPGAER
jgi:hypothetical protein